MSLAGYDWEEDDHWPLLTPCLDPNSSATSLPSEADGNQAEQTPCQFIVGISHTLGMDPDSNLLCSSILSSAHS